MDGGIQCAQLYLPQPLSKGFSHAAAPWGCLSFSEDQTSVFHSLHRLLSGHGKSVRFAAAIYSFSQPFWNTCCRIPFLFSTQAARGKATAIRNQGSPEDKRKTGSWRPLLRTRKLSALLETSAHVRLNQCLIHRLPPLSHSTVILLLLRYYSGLP